MDLIVQLVEPREDQRAYSFAGLIFVGAVGAQSDFCAYGRTEH